MAHKSGKNANVGVDPEGAELLQAIGAGTENDVILRVKQSAIDRSDVAHSAGWLSVEIPVMRGCNNEPDRGVIRASVYGIKDTGDGWADVNLGKDTGKYGMTFVSATTGESYNEMYSAGSIKRMNDEAKAYYKENSAKRETPQIDEEPLVIADEMDLPF